MDWTIGNTLTLAGLGLTLAIQIGGGLWLLSRIKTIQEEHDRRMNKLESELESHRNNEDKHHNKADFVRFEQGINEKFKSFEKGFDDVKSEMRSQFTTLIELVTNKPTRTRNTNK